MGLNTIEKWELINSKHLGNFKIFSVYHERSRSPRTGKVHSFYVLDSLDWVNIIPITPKRDVVLIRQYRHGTKEITFEIPGGIIEKGEDPQREALRELKEETGYEPQKVVSLGYVHPNPAFLNNRCFTFLALDVELKGGQDLDEKEDIEVVLKPLTTIPKLIKEGVITHSLVLCAFYRLFMEYGL